MKGEGFIMPVQRVCRPNHKFRGFQGQVESGSLKIGDEIKTLPGNEKAKVKSILVTDKESAEAYKGQAVTIQLDREVDISRGCALVKGYEPEITDMFRSTILWMDNDELVSGRNYLV